MPLNLLLTSLSAPDASLTLVKSKFHPIVQPRTARKPTANLFLDVNRSAVLFADPVDKKEADLTALLVKSKTNAALH